MTIKGQPVLYRPAGTPEPSIVCPRCDHGSIRVPGKTKFEATVYRCGNCRGTGRIIPEENK